VLVNIVLVLAVIALVAFYAVGGGGAGLMEKVVTEGNAQNKIAVVNLKGMKVCHCEPRFIGVKQSFFCACYLLNLNSQTQISLIKLIKRKVGWVTRYPRCCCWKQLCAALSFRAQPRNLFKNGYCF